VKEMNKKFELPSGDHLDRLEIVVFNLEQERSLQRFLKGSTREIQVPFSNTKITYDHQKRIGVGISKLGTAKATAVGAYAFAINELNKALK
jgi:glucokinase